MSKKIRELNILVNQIEKQGFKAKLDSDVNN